MTASTFRALHRGRAAGDPLVLPGPWDAASARVLADAGFPALATPSAGIAASLGYEDGSTPPDEMFAAVARIVRAVPVPVSADIEGGYGLAPRELVGRLLETGAVGCNLEDSEEHTTLKDPQRHADWLAGVRAEAGDALFINARVDTFLFGTGDPADAVARARLYVAAGADCVYPLMAPPRCSRCCGRASRALSTWLPDRTRSPWPSWHGWARRVSPSVRGCSGTRWGRPANSRRGCASEVRRSGRTRGRERPGPAVRRGRSGADGRTAQSWPVPAGWRSSAGSPGTTTPPGATQRPHRCPPSTTNMHQLPSHLPHTTRSGVHFRGGRPGFVTEIHDGVPR